MNPGGTTEAQKETENTFLVSELRLVSSQPRHCACKRKNEAFCQPHENTFAPDFCPQGTSSIPWHHHHFHQRRRGKCVETGPKTRSKTVKCNDTQEHNTQTGRAEHVAQTLFFASLFSHSSTLKKTFSRHCAKELKKRERQRSQGVWHTSEAKQEIARKETDARGKEQRSPAQAAVAHYSRKKKKTAYEPVPERNDESITCAPATPRRFMTATVIAFALDSSARASRTTA